jgi:hypothetical protein
MSQHKILFQRIISSDGQSFSEAKSEIITSDSDKTVSPQSGIVKVTSSATAKSASSRSSSSLE